jgi:hypothetical protein
MSEPVKKLEKLKGRFELIIALVVSVAAISATWASFEASAWNGKAGGTSSKSSILRAEANRAGSIAAEETLIDGMLWLEWQKSILVGRDELAGFLRERFSPALEKAQEAWLAEAPVDEDGAPLGALPAQTPLTLPGYVPPNQQKAQDLSAEAERLLDEGREYSATGSSYVLLTVLFALVLFLGGLATRFNSPRLNTLLGSAAVALLLFGLVRMALLPPLI